MKGVIIALIVGVAVGIVVTVIVTSMIQSSLLKKDFDFDYIRHLQEIENCLDLKKEYDLIKKHHSILGHYELYVKAIEDRAKEIAKYPLACNFK